MFCSGYYVPHCMSFGVHERCMKEIGALNIPEAMQSDAYFSRVGITT